MVTRAQKEEIVSNLQADLQDSSVALVADFVGLSMEQLSDCRTKMRSAAAKCVVVKNTLAGIALKGSDLEPVTQYLQGPSLLVIGKEDPSQLIKSFQEFQKTMDEGSLPLKGGAFPGEALSASDIDAIGKLPSKEVLLGQIAGSLVATPSTIANTINRTIGDIGELAVKVAEKQNS